MKKYYCDVCGTELPIGGKALTAPPDSVIIQLGLEDLCPGCENFARELDARGLVLAKLRRLAQVPPKPEPLPGFSPVPVGRGAGEKREILDALNAFRREHGPGAIGALARKAKVEEGVLRDILQCQKVPIATWRKVGKALGIAEEV